MYSVDLDLIPSLMEGGTFVFIFFKSVDFNFNTSLRMEEFIVLMVILV